MTDVIKLIRSRIVFTIKGHNVTGIVNMLDEAEWVRWEDAETAIVCTSLAEYRKIRDFCRRNGYKTRIKRKSGVAFATYPLRKRYGLLCGVAFFFFTLYLLTSRIWTFSVTSDRADESHVYEVARQYGITHGAKKADLDIPSINREIMKNHSEFQYFNVNFYGCHAEIVVRQRDNIKQVVDENALCDIVSDKDGIVEKIIVRDGIAAVKKGDTVIKGEILIKGEMRYMIGEEEVSYPIHSQGEAYLKTYRREYEIMPSAFNFREYTGREKKRYTFIIGDKGFPLYFLEKNPYMCYDKRYKVSYFTLFDRNRLPIGFSCEIYKEATYKKAVVQADEAELFNKMRERLFQKYGVVDIKADSLEIIEKGEYILAKYEAECLEKAGVEKLK